MIHGFPRLFLKEAFILINSAEYALHRCITQGLRREARGYAEEGLHGLTAFDSNSGVRTLFRYHIAKCLLTEAFKCMGYREESRASA